MEALELGVGCLTAMFLAAILYQQISNSQQQIVSLKTARVCVALLAVGTIVLSAIGMWSVMKGGDL